MSTCLNKISEIKDRWSEFGGLNGQQKVERTKDVQVLLDGLNDKMKNLQTFDSAKSSVFMEQISSLDATVGELRQAGQILQEHRKRQIELSLMEADQDCNNAHKQIEQVVSAVNRQCDVSLAQMKQSVVAENEAIVDEVKRQKKQIIQMKQHVAKVIKQAHQQQAESLKQLYGKMDQEINAVYDYLEARKAEKAAKEQKLKYMIENLMEDLESAIGKQEKFGKMTYDCLLALIEDFHNKYNRRSYL